MEKIEIYAYRIILNTRTENKHPQFLLDLLKGNGLYEEYTTFLGNKWKSVNCMLLSTEELLVIPGKNYKPVLAKFIGKFNLDAEEKSISKTGSLSVRKSWGEKEFFMSYKKQVDRLFERLYMNMKN